MNAENNCSCVKEKENSKCCSSEKESKCCSSEKERIEYISGYIGTEKGEIPLVKTELSIADYTGIIKMRIGIGRFSYKVKPGLYGIGNPDKTSPVFVTSNYKMTFDFLRKELNNINCWILVIDTKGINVWCAAGKGTFGTCELLNRIEATGLLDVVSHRELIVPQLGAPGIASHEVKKKSGFKIIYGPVRAEDIKDFMNNGMKATPYMRRVKFTFLDRLCITPVEITGSLNITFIALVISAIIGGIDRTGFSLKTSVLAGVMAFSFYLAGLFSGAVLTPALLPWIPGRPFALKGLISGLIVAMASIQIFYPHFYPWYGGLNVLPWLIVIPALSSFFAMNFTGASTYTSLSGVLKEVRLALPLQIFALISGIILWIIFKY